tara:strand:+ start:197 stop:388 length:192 start_codon:yes stop_codon:yes gene_type:complete
MNLKEKLQNLAQQREQLTIAIYEINGAMKLLEQQILETQESDESNQPLEKEALKHTKETASSK